MSSFCLQLAEMLVSESTLANFPPVAPAPPYERCRRLGPPGDASGVRGATRSAKISALSAAREPALH